MTPSSKDKQRVASSTKQHVYFDSALLITAVALIVAWAFDLAWVFVPLACLLGLAMVFWDHDVVRRLRGEKAKL